jgi:hypothetical protein
VVLDCSLVTAERILQFVEELRTEVPAADREGLILAYREVLLNAMQHGAGSDPHESVEVAAVRTERSIVFYVKDPGEGFDVVSATARAERQAPTWSQGLEGESPQGFECAAGPDDRQRGDSQRARQRGRAHQAHAVMHPGLPGAEPGRHEVEPGISPVPGTPPSSSMAG